MWCMRKTLFALVVAAALVAGCTAYGGGESTPDATNGGSNGDIAVPDADVVVNYTADGFVPGTVTILEGETVAWVDRHPTADMWVASANHPTHTVYDGTGLNEHCPADGTAFDQCSGGETYTFTFQKTGEWGYHNHLRSSDRGTVVVE